MLAADPLIRARDFLSDKIPLLTLMCGNTSTTVLATWQAVTDGAFQFFLAGTEYSVSAADFSGAADFDGLATVVQARIRAATSGTTETCVWDATGFFKIADTTSAVNFLYPPDTGTDITTSTWLNGRIGGSAYLEGAESSARWDTSTLLRFLRDAQRRVWERRPDTRINASDALATITIPTDLGDTLILDDKWLEPLAHGVAARAFAMDAGDQNNTRRSQEHDKAFNASLY